MEIPKLICKLEKINPSGRIAQFDEILPEGVEPPTRSLEGSRSIQLSYERIRNPPVMMGFWYDVRNPLLCCIILGEWQFKLRHYPKTKLGHYPIRE